MVFQRAAVFPQRLRSESVRRRALLRETVRFNVITTGGIGSGRILTFSLAQFGRIDSSALAGGDFQRMLGSIVR